MEYIKSFNKKVIFYKNPKGNTFKEIYDNMMNEAEEYGGRVHLGERDTFKAPHINFNVKREYKEFENKQFPTKDPAYPTAEIVKAIQSIQFTLDENGGKVKSEAVIDMLKSAMMPNNEPREFAVDDTFTLFLKETEKDIPYFAVTVDDISRYQQAYQ